MRLFITGTDTDCGKTWITCALLRALGQRGISAAGFKPVCCGPRDDVGLLQAVSAPGVTDEEINPVWFRHPLAPMTAARFENREFPLQAVLDGWEKLSARHEHILVEGAGGWEVPLTRDQTMGDLAVRLGLPVVVVVNNRLGALNHTILTVRSIQSRGLVCAGIILNHVADERDSASISNAAILTEVLGVPVLADMMHGETDLPPGDWEKLLP